MDASLEILLSHRSKLLGFVKKRISDPDLAEDLFQEALLRAVQKAPDESEERVLAWFYRVLRNAVIDHYRRQAADERRMQSALHAFPEELSLADEEELCGCFAALLPSLKPEYREMIELELQEEDPAETAKRLGVDRNNLKVRRFRARNQLRQRLEETCRTCAEHGCLDCTCKKSGSAHSG